MPIDLTEENFEDTVVEILTEESGYTQRDSRKDFDHEWNVDTEDLFAFIKDSQEDTWQEYEEIYGDGAREQFLRRLTKQINERGMHDVLTSGIRDRGIHFELAYFLPASGLNEAHRKKYEKNRFSVARQFAYSQEYNNTLDVVILLNGLPIFTFELKNRFSGQQVGDAISQYKNDRNPKLAFFQHCLAHFAVDNDEVYFASELDGEDTEFFPFNKDYPNPEDPRGFKVSYLFFDILAPDSVLNIIQNFIRRIESEGDDGGFQVFPRYHQLDATRRVVETAEKTGAGKNYLIQHSAGSGKTFTIAWLAHQLAELHNEDDERVYDTVIVASDRIVIEDQLREAVTDFSDTEGTVHVADHSDDLKVGLQAGKNIIVTTEQKFSVIADEMKGVDGDTFAVLIDEAHTGQGGTTTHQRNRTLSAGSLEEAEQDEANELDVQEQIVADIEASGVQDNVSYIAFTATPKPETLEMFGEEDGEPFSLYSMRQAIEEGFILDVLENFINYETYFDLVRTIQEDPEYERRKATALLRKHVDLHEHAVEEKADIILKHFLGNVLEAVNGQGKAMVVTKSRLHVVRFTLALRKLLRGQGRDVGVLAAFSGTVKDGGKEFTEAGMNDVRQSTKEAFDTPDFRIMVVANKYQTGFDQPKLQTMYVDKVLSGVNAVQTLSRLNRQHPAKDKVFVLDFVNKPEQIQEAFAPYYEKMRLSEQIDPNVVYEYEREVREFGVINEREVEKFTKIWFSGDENQFKLHTALSPAVDRYLALDDEEKAAFRDVLRRFTKSYAYILQLVKFSDTSLHELYLYTRLLLKKLPVDKQTLPSEIVNNIDMETYRVEKKFEGSVSPGDGPREVDRVSDGNVSGKTEDEREPLSKIIDGINERFGTELLGEEAKESVGWMKDKIEEDEGFQDAQEANTAENLRPLFNELFEDAVGGVYSENADFYKKLERHPDMKIMIMEFLRDQVLAKSRPNE